MTCHIVSWTDISSFYLYRKHGDIFYESVRRFVFCFYSQRRALTLNPTLNPILNLSTTLTLDSALTLNCTPTLNPTLSLNTNPKHESVTDALTIHKPKTPIWVRSCKKLPKKLLNRKKLLNQETDPQS